MIEFHLLNGVFTESSICVDSATCTSFALIFDRSAFILSLSKIQSIRFKTIFTIKSLAANFYADYICTLFNVI